MSDNKTYTFNYVVVHPDALKLEGEVEKLRTELSMLVLERDNLIHHTCKQIETAYMLEFGALEYKIYETECAILRLKRKAEFIQAQKNRQENVDITQIEKTLDDEFEEYQQKLNERMNKMNDALEYRNNAKPLSDEEKAELKKLYRAIVKMLHPDLNPNLSAEKIKLFHNAVDAYKNGDLKNIKIISTMISEPIILDEKTDAVAFFAKEKDRLLAALQDIKNSIAKVKSEFPYTARDFLKNEEKIEERKSKLEERIKHLNETLAAYTERVAEMLR